MDEAENLWSQKDEGSRTIQDILREGYKKGGRVMKCEQDGEGKQKLLFLDPYSPKALSGISGIEEALSTRCIEILMKESGRKEIVNRYIKTQEAFWGEVRDGLMVWGMENAERAQREFEGMDSEFLGRTAELWLPMLAVARINGKEQEVLEIAKRKVSERKEENSNREEATILRALYFSVKTLNDPFLTIPEICQRIYWEDEEGFAWLMDERKKGTRGRWLAAKLKRMGVIIGSAMQKRGGAGRRGYHLYREKIEEAMTRYGVSGTDEEAKEFERKIKERVEDKPEGGGWRLPEM